MLASCATHPLLVCGSLLYSFQSKILWCRSGAKCTGAAFHSSSSFGVTYLILADTKSNKHLLNRFFFCSLLHLAHVHAHVGDKARVSRHVTSRRCASGST